MIGPFWQDTIDIVCRHGPHFNIKMIFPGTGSPIIQMKEDGRDHYTAYFHNFYTCKMIYSFWNCPFLSQKLVNNVTFDYVLVAKSLNISGYRFPHSIMVWLLDFICFPSWNHKDKSYCHMNLIYKTNWSSSLQEHKLLKSSGPSQYKDAVLPVQEFPL